jgi:iron complex outermembrane receptor protein
VQKLEDLEVKEKATVNGVGTTQTETVIDVDNFKTVGPQTSVIDVLKTSAVIDFRGDNSLDPGVDSIFLRGFDAKRFVTAIDGLTIQKTGGRKSSNIVDYSLLPTFLLKEVEILPGPHSALYDSKSIGGVINMVTKEPTKRDSLKPDITTTAGYGSDNTVNSTTTVSGAVQNFTYDLAYRFYQTDGYLRNSETELNTWYARLGYLLPADGYVTASASATATDRQAPVNNPGSDGDFDSDYPITSGGLFDPYSKPTWDGESYVYRLNAHQPTPVGTIDLEAATSKDNRKRAYYASPTAKTTTVMDTDWWTDSAKIMDDYRWNKEHATIIGYDFAKMYDNGVDDEKTERIKKQGAFLQHTWDILPSFQAQVGARYEDVDIMVTNQGQVKGRPDLVYRSFDQIMPKAFFTWKMDEMAAWLRDTLLSAGVSRIWRAPDYHGDYNPQGKPTGIYMEPEHGMGYDLILSRRLVKDIAIKFDASFYDIEDYMAYNSSYAKYSDASAGYYRYSDYMVNLEEVYRYGLDIDLSGHITDQLSFNLSYSWQDFDNRGDEPAGETELDQRAAHRISAGLRYEILANTALQLDYTFQSDETIEVSEEVADDVWDFREVDNDAYHTVDFAVEQKLPFVKGWLKDAIVTVYVKNILDEEYFDTTGFPASGRTVGTTLTLSW